MSTETDRVNMLLPILDWIGIFTLLAEHAHIDATSQAGGELTHAEHPIGQQIYEQLRGLLETHAREPLSEYGISLERGEWYELIKHFNQCEGFACQAARARVASTIGWELS